MHSAVQTDFVMNIFVCARNHKYSETSIKRTPSIKRTLSRVPKLTSYVFLYNEPLLTADNSIKRIDVETKLNCIWLISIVHLTQIFLFTSLKYPC